MILLEDFRKRNPYNRQNTEGQSVFAWKEQTRQEWIIESLTEAKKNLANPFVTDKDILRTILTVMSEMR